MNYDYDEENKQYISEDEARPKQYSGSTLTSGNRRFRRFNKYLKNFE